MLLHNLLLPISRDNRTVSIFKPFDNEVDRTRKRDKAQRVARPACANATVHFLLTYRLAMLLPPSEWPFKTSAQRILAYGHSPPMQISHEISGVTGPKFTKFVSDVAESSSMLTQQSRSDILVRCECQCTECFSFRQQAPQIGYHSNIPWASRRNRNLLLWTDLPVYILWMFGEKQSWYSIWNIGNVSRHKIGCHGNGPCPEFAKFLAVVNLLYNPRKF